MPNTKWVMMEDFVSRHLTNRILPIHIYQFTIHTGLGVFTGGNLIPSVSFLKAINRWWKKIRWKFFVCWVRYELRIYTNVLTIDVVDSKKIIFVDNWHNLVMSAFPNFINDKSYQTLRGLVAFEISLTGCLFNHSLCNRSFITYTNKRFCVAGFIFWIFSFFCNVLLKRERKILPFRNEMKPKIFKLDFNFLTFNMKEKEIKWWIACSVDHSGTSSRKLTNFVFFLFIKFGYDEA